MNTDFFNILSQGHFPGMMGIKILEIKDQTIRAEMPVKPEFQAPNKYLHAGSVVTFADTSAGYSTVLNLPEGAKSFTTIELKTNFVRTLKEGVLTCQSEAEHLGRTTQIWRIQVKDQATGKLMSIFSCTQMILY